MVEWIKLSESEILQSMGDGNHMARISLEANLRNLKCSAESDAAVSIRGQLGHLAVCKCLRIPYEYRPNRFREADIPKWNIEIRTRGSYQWDCKVRIDDDASRRVVMAVCPSHIYPVCIVGWIEAGEARRRFPHTIDPGGYGKPFHGIPKEALYPIATLRKLIGTQ